MYLVPRVLFQVPWSLRLWPRRCPWVTWMCGGEACIPGCHGESSWQASTRRALHRPQMETHPHSSAEEAWVLACSFSLRGRLPVRPTSEAVDGPQRTDTAGAILAPPPAGLQLSCTSG